MVQFLEDLKGVGAPPLTPQERLELEDLRAEAASLKKKLSVGKQLKKVESSGSESEGEEVHELKPVVKPQPNAKPKARTSVSAEAFGKYHQKEQYVAKVVPKSIETKQK